jgi:hypothetical protein
VRLKQEDYHAPAPRVLEIGVGIVLGLISVVFVFFGLLAGYHIASGDKVPTEVIWAATVFLVIGVMTGRVTVRLLTGRGKRGGSALFSPNTIRLFGFIVFLVGPVVTLTSWKRPLDLLNLVASFSMAAACFALAARRDRQKRLADSEKQPAKPDSST